MNEQAVREHIAWLHQYMRCATPQNWRDMMANADRQIDWLTRDLNLKQER